MRQVTVDFIIEQIIAGYEPKFLAVESIGVSGMDYSGDVERGCIYKATMSEGSSGQTFISFYDYNDTKLEPFSINYTSINSNMSIKSSENKLLSRLFRFVEDLDALIPSVIEDGPRAMSDKEDRMRNAFAKFIERDEYEYYTNRNGIIVFEAKVRHFPIIARHFRNSYQEQGLKKYLFNWHIDADLAEFSFYNN